MVLVVNTLNSKGKERYKLNAINMLKRSLNLVSLLQTLIYSCFLFSVHTPPSTSSCKPGGKKNHNIIDKGRNNNNNNNNNNNKNNNNDDDDGDDDEDDSTDNYKIQIRLEKKSLALNRSFI